MLALDYGRVHTGVAISDSSGTLARPLKDIAEAAAPAGIRKIGQIMEDETVFCAIVGMPLSLSGQRGEQARETEKFLAALRASVDVPVFAWDERFTSKMAAAQAGRSNSSVHSLAACVLLEDYLRSAEYRRRVDK